MIAFLCDGIHLHPAMIRTNIVGGIIDVGFDAYFGIAHRDGYAGIRERFDIVNHCLS